jgi:hypothetical protein
MTEREYLLTRPPEGSPAPPPACPYLDCSTGLCSGHERRLLGCRTHFCGRALPDAAARASCERLHERALAEVLRLAAARGIEGDYAPAIERLALHLRGRAAAAEG